MTPDFDDIAKSAGIALALSVIANVAQWRLMMTLMQLVRDSVEALKVNNFLLREAIEDRRNAR